MHLVDQIASPYPKALMEQRTSLNLDAWPTPSDYYYNIREGELPLCYLFIDILGCSFACFGGNHSRVSYVSMKLSDKLAVYCLSASTSCALSRSSMAEAQTFTACTNIKFNHFPIGSAVTHHLPQDMFYASCCSHTKAEGAS